MTYSPPATLLRDTSPVDIAGAVQVDANGGDDTPPDNHGRLILWPTAIGVDAHAYYLSLDDDSGCHRMSRSDSDGLFDVVTNTDCVHVAAAIEQPEHIDLEITADALASGPGTPHGIFVVPNPSDETGDLWLNYRQLDGKEMGGDVHLGGTNINIGTGPTKNVGFYGATPVAQQANANQAAVDTTASTNVAPYGFTQPQADGIVTLLNEIRSALVTLGLMKGAA